MKLTTLLWSSSARSSWRWVSLTRGQIVRPFSFLTSLFRLARGCTLLQEQFAMLTSWYGVCRKHKLTSLAILGRFTLQVSQMYINMHVYTFHWIYMHLTCISLSKFRHELYMSIFCVYLSWGWGLLIFLHLNFFCQRFQCLIFSHILLPSFPFNPLLSSTGSQV